MCCREEKFHSGYTEENYSTDARCVARLHGFCLCMCDTNCLRRRISFASTQGGRSTRCTIARLLYIDYICVREEQLVLGKANTRTGDTPSQMSLYCLVSHPLTIQCLRQPTAKSSSADIVEHNMAKFLVELAILD